MIQAVTKVSVAKTPLTESNPLVAFSRLGVHGVEACSGPNAEIVTAPYHPFVAAVHVAFAEHRPLVLSPDMFWLLVTQAFARHMRVHAEGLRKSFVEFDGRQALKVRRDAFVKGSPDNDWPGVFGEFSAQIKDRIGAANHARLVTEFSTAGPIEKAANEIVMMDALRSFFQYEMFTLCGIPEVHLEGDPQDWARLAQRVSELGEAYQLEWTRPLAPIFERIAANAAGQEDAELWRGIYKLDEQSGGPYVNGWITAFFPSLSGGQYGVTLDQLPGSLSRAPFRWFYLDQEFEMEFLAGFHGYSQDPLTLAVRPEIGWCIADGVGSSGEA